MFPFADLTERHTAASCDGKTSTTKNDHQDTLLSTNKPVQVIEDVHTYRLLTLVYIVAMANTLSKYIKTAFRVLSSITMSPKSLRILAV